MKSKFLNPRLLAAFGAASLAFGGAAQAQKASPTFDTHSILVLSSSTSSSALRTRGLRVTRQYKNIGWSKVALAPGADVAATVAALRAQGVEAEPNFIVHAFKTPNDPQYGSLWGMEKIGAPAAWNITTGGTELVGGKDVVVAILDSGITPNHPDLKANLYVNRGEIPGNGRDDDGNGFVDDVNGYDFTQDNGVPDDGNEHGTHVAGTVGAVGNNKTGVVGVNWRVKLLSLRVLNSDGAGFGSSIISAMDYMVGLKKAGVNIRVGNHSYGAPVFSKAEQAAFQRASAVGILDVCAAGNDGYNNDVAPSYPANYHVPGLISVAATDINDQLADFSNIGPRNVALAAPGVDILSTLPPGVNQDGSSYGVLSGTSMASPHVAGALALMLSQMPTLSMQQAQARLYASVDKLPQLKGKVSTGGRLNVAKMLSGAIYALTGRITRADGTPVSNAVVSLAVGTSTTPLTTTTDSNGVYRFSALVAGNYTLSAKLNGFTFAAATGSSLKFSLGGSRYAQTENMIARPVAATYSVFGIVLNAFGKPQAGVQFFVDKSPQPVAVSDSRGKYTIDDLAAGTYSLSAQFQGVTVLSDSRQSVKDVQLPATFGTSAPNVQVNWQVPPIDRISPTLTLTSPVNGQSYPMGQLQAVAGNAYDNDQLTTLEFSLYQLQGNAPDRTTFLPYDWTTGMLTDGTSFAPPKVITVNRASTSFNIPLADLPLGRYYLFSTARDRSGNSTGSVALFSVTMGGQTIPNPQQAPYPRFKFDYPFANSVVRSGRAFTATGSAHADNGVQTLNFYLQQVDERGVGLGYFDWVNKQFVSEQDSTTTLTQTYNGGTDVNWSLPMPALPSNRYVLRAFGVALDGSQPPADGSLDDSVPFRASATGVSPTPTPAPSTSGS